MPFLSNKEDSPMKKAIISLIGILLCSISLSAKAQFSKQQADDLVLYQLLANQQDRVDVFSLSDLQYGPGSIFYMTVPGSVYPIMNFGSILLMTILLPTGTMPAGSFLSMRYPEAIFSSTARNIRSDGKRTIRLFRWHHAQRRLTSRTDRYRQLTACLPIRTCLQLSFVASIEFNCN